MYSGEGKKPVVGEVQSLFPLWYSHKKIVWKIVVQGLPKSWNLA